MAAPPIIFTIGTSQIIPVRNVRLSAGTIAPRANGLIIPAVLRRGGPETDIAATYNRFHSAPAALSITYFLWPSAFECAIQGSTARQQSVADV